MAQVWPLPRLRPKRSAYGFAGLRFRSGQRDSKSALIPAVMATVFRPVRGYAVVTPHVPVEALQGMFISSQLRAVGPGLPAVLSELPVVRLKSFPFQADSFVQRLCLLLVFHPVRGSSGPGFVWLRRVLPSESEQACSDRKSTRLNSSHGYISYAVFCLKKKKKNIITELQM